MTNGRLASLADLLVFKYIMPIHQYQCITSARPYPDEHRKEHAEDIHINNPSSSHQERPNLQEATGPEEDIFPDKNIHRTCFALPFRLA
jgi:hypothetical protein